MYKTRCIKISKIVILLGILIKYGEKVVCCYTVVFSLYTDIFLRETTTNIATEYKSQGKQMTDVCTKCYIIMKLRCYYSHIHKALLTTFIVT
jgi:hypothetical protein